jgi:hypothetical protein
MPVICRRPSMVCVTKSHRQSAEYCTPPMRSFDSYTTFASSLPNGGSHCITRSLRSSFASFFASAASFFSSFGAGSICKNDMPLPSGRHSMSRRASGSNGAGARFGSSGTFGCAGLVTGGAGFFVGGCVAPFVGPPFPLVVNPLGPGMVGGVGLVTAAGCGSVSRRLRSASVNSDLPSPSQNSSFDPNRVNGA